MMAGQAGAGGDQTIGNMSGVWGRQNQRYPTLADHPAVVSRAEVRLVSVLAQLDHAIFGHAGNNHFHVNILPRDDAELQRAKAIYAEFAAAIVARGGCVSAEHGIGRIKRHFLPVQYGATTLDAMRAAKRWLDPANSLATALQGLMCRVIERGTRCSQ
jgi:FAD/FMN-containing dehydrogenase